MLFSQIYLGCLAQASYLIGSEGTAAVIDPRRDVDEYLEAAEREGLRIAHVILSHIHADFVAGHTELAARTGAQIHLSHRVDCGFARNALRDGDVIAFGQAEITVLETPGHTPSDVCLLVRDLAAPDAPPRLLTGDTLFIGDVGRPDLAGGAGFSATDMAGMMYDSLRAKLLPLDDAVEVYPGHGAGSACGRNISSETSSTIGHQRLANHALQPMERAAFVQEMTRDVVAPPRYFGHAAELNRRGPRTSAELPPLRTLTPDDALRDDGLTLLDTRSAAAYGGGHRAGTINVGLSGSFETWCGCLLDFDRGVVLVAEDGDTAAEARLRLARVGIEKVAGWVRASELPETTERLPQMSVRELAGHIGAGGWQVIDVRQPGEYDNGHAPGAVPAPLRALPGSADPVDALDRGCRTAVICGSGYRSSAAVHFLRAAGFTDLHNVIGGTTAWVSAGLDVER